jgi:hypothetical protein
MCVVAIIPPKVNLCHISRGLLNNRGAKRHTASTAFGQHDSAHIETVGGIINITGKIPRKIFETSFLRNRAPGQRTTFFAVLLAKWAVTEVARCVQLAGDIHHALSKYPSRGVASAPAILALLSCVPSRATLRDWFDRARIPRFKPNRWLAEAAARSVTPSLPSKNSSAPARCRAASNPATVA